MKQLLQGSKNVVVCEIGVTDLRTRPDCAVLSVVTQPGVTSQMMFYRLSSLLIV